MVGERSDWREKRRTGLEGWEESGGEGGMGWRSGVQWFEGKGRERRAGLEGFEGKGGEGGKGLLRLIEAWSGRTDPVINFSYFLASGVLPHHDVPAEKVSQQSAPVPAQAMPHPKPRAYSH